MTGKNAYDDDQSERFLAAASAIEADKNEEMFQGALDSILKHKNPARESKAKKPQKGKRTNK